MVSLSPVSSLKTAAAVASASPNQGEGGEKETSSLAAELKQTFEVLGGLKEKVASLEARPAQQVTAPREEPKPEAEVDPFETPEFEGLDRKAMGQTISRHAQQQIRKQLEPLAKTLEQLSNRLAAIDARSTVAEFRVENPDVMDWKSELGKVYSDPGKANMPLPDAYALVRAKDPEKANALDKKYGRVAAFTGEEQVQEEGQGAPPGVELPEGYVPKGFQVHQPRQRTEGDLKLFSMAPSGQAQSDRQAQASNQNMSLKDGVSTAMGKIFANQTRIQRGVRG